MQITINKEDLSHVDCGGGMRQVSVIITIDTTLPLRRQQEIVTYEVLGACLDNDSEERHDFLEDLATKIVDAQYEL